MEEHYYKIIFIGKKKREISLMYANLQISHILQLVNRNDFSLVMGFCDVRYRKISALLLMRETKLKK